MDKPWRILKLDIKAMPDGRIVVANLDFITAGLIQSSPRIFWVFNSKDYHIFMGGHYHPKGTKIEVLAPVVKKAEFELHSQEVCEVVELDPVRNESLLVPYGVEHLARIPPGGVVVGMASTAEKDGENCERINCHCRRTR